MKNAALLFIIIASLLCLIPYSVAAENSDEAPAENDGGGEPQTEGDPCHKMGDDDEADSLAHSIPHFSLMGIR